MLARQNIMHFHLLALAAVSWDFFTIPYKKDIYHTAKGGRESNYGIDTG